MMIKRVTGRYERMALGGEEVAAFVPDPLPPSKPPLVLSSALIERLRTAEQALAKLDIAGSMVPSLDWFIYAFVRKEAVLSSQIEGTQATLIDLLAYEAQANNNDSPPRPDVEEICNYLDALTFARAQLADPGGLPLSMRLLNEAHRRLMHGVRGADKQPGEVRITQNWIGGSRPGNAAYVPPPPHALGEVLSALEKYIHADDSLPPLVRAGLLHVQFETIHPYLDGNGRLGRLLVTLLLEHWQLLKRPLLYLSLFFKRHRQTYYHLLNNVRVAGDWGSWLDFFLDGVATVANEAIDTAQDLFALISTDSQRLLAGTNVTIAALRLFDQLPRQPVITVSFAMEKIAASKPTAGRAIKALVEAGVLVQTTDKKRDRSWVYRAYVDCLCVGTELERG